MTRLPDEYEQLAAGLREAAARETAHREAPGHGETADGGDGRAKRSLRSWISRHTLATALVLAGIGGTATAAVLTLRGEPSGQMTGQLHGATSDTRYSIHLVPSPGLGQPGWCTTVTLAGVRPEQRSGGGGCGPAPTVHRLTTTAGIIGGGMDQRHPENVWLMHAVVDAAVAGVRFHGSGRVVLSRRDPGIPAGTRLVVAGLGEAEYGPLDRAPQVGWDLLDREGRKIGSDADDSRSDLVAKQRWHVVDGLLPASAPCRISFSGSVASLGRTRSVQLDAPPTPTPELRGRALLGCSKTEFPGGPPFTDDRAVTVFVDAASPGVRPMDLPGFESGTDGIGELGGSSAPNPERGRLSAKRVGNAWVVVQGPTRAARVELLRQVSVDLPAQP